MDASSLISPQSLYIASRLIFLMRARSIIAYVLCFILVSILAFPALGNITHAPEEEAIQLTGEEQKLRYMNRDFRTIGSVGTYEDYMASRTEEPFQAMRTTRGPAPEYHKNAILVMVELVVYTLSLIHI